MSGIRALTCDEALSASHRFSPIGGATRRPAAYLDEHVRRGISIWARVGPDAEQRAVRSLRDDLASGRWAERNRDLAGLEAAELGLRLLIG
jgi:hypothetical protein